MMSKQIFEDAVLSCVDCGEGGPSSGIRGGICPQLGSQTLLLPAQECPSGPLCPRSCLTPGARFLKDRRLKFGGEKKQKKNFPAFSLHEFLVNGLLLNAQDFSKIGPPSVLNGHSWYKMQECNR